jgi:hypothetical protein
MAHILASGGDFFGSDCFRRAIGLDQIIWQVNDEGEDKRKINKQTTRIRIEPARVHVEYRATR